MTTVAVSVPTELATTSVTVKPGLVFWDEYTYVGFRSDEVPAPSPKFHDQTGAQPAVMFSDVSVNVNTVPGRPGLFRKPLVGETVNCAVGAKQGVTVGLGVGVAVGAGVADPDGVGAGVGVGVGVGDGVGDGVGVDATPVAGGVAICTDADERNVTFCPPVNAAMSGVSRRKWPVTVTVAVWPEPVVQVGVQVMATSLVETLTNEPLASLMTRHMTRLVVVLHAEFATKDVGLDDASTAPSRAALDTVICE
jgi:hypothetical protein